MRSAAAAYSILLASAIFLVYLQGRVGAVLSLPGPMEFVRNTLIGLGTAGAVLGISEFGRKRFRWVRDLDREFTSLIGPLRPGDPALLALTSGLGEEFFFRAALQPMLGLWATSALFGLLHYPANRRLLPWPFLAGLMGLIFGTLYAWTESLLLVALAHGLINYAGLWEIARRR